ncbi:hypothetical protein D3C76_1394700 [compost metagenome]
MPSSSNCSDEPLGTVSVVIMPDAASYQAASCKVFNAGRSPASKRSIGSCSPITPVENGKISELFTPAISANFAQVS